MTLATLVALCGFSFLAGFIDAVVGGGGLIQLPALMVMMPAAPIPTLLGTNKFSSAAGTLVAAYRYSLHVSINWRMVGPSVVAAFAFSFLGSKAVTLVNPTFLRPVILILLVGVGLYVFFVRDLGLIHKPRHVHRKALGLGIVTGMALGFYDGFFGPGTGSFLIIVFVGLFGFSFLAASASAKVINLGTNLASVIYFGFTDQILYRAAVPMALCNILGSVTGTRLAILKGSQFVRVSFLVVVVALIAKLTRDIVWK